MLIEPYGKQRAALKFFFSLALALKHRNLIYFNIFFHELIHLRMCIFL